MKTLHFDTKEEWIAARKGKITGTRLKNIIVKRGTGKKIGFYELIAERLRKSDAPAGSDEELFDTPVDEKPTERGLRLEPRALELFTERTGKKVDGSLLMWVRDDDENIAISPDGVISETEAVEVKCLADARHVEALLTQSVPDEYEYQALQYFIVNDKLQTLYFCFYDPRLMVKEFFWLEIKRADLLTDIEEYFIYQKKELAEVDEIVNSLLATIQHAPTPLQS